MAKTDLSVLTKNLDDEYFIISKYTIAKKYLDKVHDNLTENDPAKTMLTILFD